MPKVISKLSIDSFQHGGNQGKTYRGKLKKKLIQAFPEKFMLFQPNHRVPEIVASKDSTLKENNDTLVDKNVNISKDAEYIREDNIRF